MPKIICVDKEQKENILSEKFAFHFVAQFQKVVNSPLGDLQFDCKNEITGNHMIEGALLDIAQYTTSKGIPTEWQLGNLPPVLYSETKLSEQPSPLMQMKICFLKK